MKQNISLVPPPLGDCRNMAKAAWYFLKACKLPFHYSKRDIIKSRKFIDHLILNANDHFGSYLELCQRIMKLKGSKSFRHTLPIEEILSIQLEGKKVGFNGYKLRAMGEGILDMIENHSEQTRQFWFKWFTENNAGDELVLFVLSICEPQFELTLKSGL